jgi:methionyl aminopeptidase
MIQVKSQREIEIMARGGEILAATVRLLENSVRPGMTTMDLDKIADDFIRSHPGATPAF